MSVPMFPFVATAASMAPSLSMTLSDHALPIVYWVVAFHLNNDRNNVAGDNDPGVPPSSNSGDLCISSKDDDDIAISTEKS